ncbi:MAG: T9SS type A sorting domain-containing protein, partial [Saprospiraceae bacterium]
YPNGILDYKNYKLKSNSLYFKNGTDQLDLGVDFNKLDSAFFQSRNCPPITTYTTEKANPEFIKIEHFVSNDNISFKIQGMKAKYILLTDLTGKRVLHNNMNSNAFELKTNSFLPGLYIVTFASDLKSISKLISIHP